MQNSNPPAGSTLVYAGTYTNTKSKSKGIYVYWLKTRNLEVSQNITLMPVGVAAETDNPSFFDLDLKRRLLFTINEVEIGTVTAFSIDSSTGTLKLINKVASGGARPCHLTLDRSGKFLLVANYNNGSVAVLPVAADGRLSEPGQVIQHTGKSIHPQRQTGPHAHCVTMDPANRFAFVCDLGVDKVFSYRFDAASGKLRPNDPPSQAAKAGAGPRHMVFRPDGKFAYVINELNSTVVTYSCDSAIGKLNEVQTVSTLPEYYDGPNTAGEVEVHPAGKFLYVSNRGNNTVVLFNVEPEKGTLTYVEEQGTGGNTPRHFGIQPSAEHLVIANQDTDQLLASRIDAGNGRLKPSGLFAECPSPACAKFVPPR
jgi:6-phosphogluconolactonase